MKALTLAVDLCGTPEYLGSTWEARAVWLSLLFWCAERENGGRIEGASDWTDERWGLAGVTRQAVQSAPSLIIFDNGTAVVFGYPTEQEEVLRAKRSGGKASWAVRSVNKSKTLPKTLEKTLREIPSEELPEIPANLMTAEFMKAWGEWIEYRHARKLARYKTRSMSKQLAELSDWGHDEAIRSINDSIRQNWQGLFPPKNSAAGGRKASFA